MLYGKGRGSVVSDGFRRWNLTHFSFSIQLDSVCIAELQNIAPL